MHVEDAELARHPGVLELEVGLEVRHAVVPGEHLLVDGDRHGGGEEGLGGRADLEDRLGVHRLAALAAHPEALRVNQAVTGDDADGEAGHVEVPHPALDIGLELGRQRLDAPLHRFLGKRPEGGTRGGERGEEQASGDDARSVDGLPPGERGAAVADGCHGPGLQLAGEGSAGRRRSKLRRPQERCRSVGGMASASLRPL